MKCPSCRKNSITFSRILLSGCWSPAKCANCGAVVVPRPMAHLAVSVIIPFSLLAPFIIYGGSSPGMFIVLLCIGISLSVCTSLVIFRALPLVGDKSRAYKIERNIFYAGLGVIIAYTVLNSLWRS